MAGWTFNRPARRKRAPPGSRDTVTESRREPPADAPVEPAVGGGADQTADTARSRPVVAPRALWPDVTWPLDSLLAAAATEQVGALHQTQLSRVVEVDIIPRLLLLHRVPLRPLPPGPAASISDDEVQALADLAVNGTPEATEAFVLHLVRQGASHEQVLLELLAPAARWMGRLWEEDIYSFSQVTIGLWRLQRVLHELAHPVAAAAHAGADGRRVLLAAVPGSQHTFGVAMAAEFFTRAGWDVTCEPCVSWADLRSRVADRWFDVFGLSVSASHSVTQAASGILDIRRAAANPQLFVMVGGPMASVMPDLGQRCGADAMARDAPAAVAAANASLRRGVKAV